MRLRWWLHSQRPSHDRNMALAQAAVESARSHLGTPRWQEPNAALLGRHELKAARQTVELCGCPREIWPPFLQGAIEESQ